MVLQKRNRKLIKVERDKYSFIFEHRDLINRREQKDFNYLSDLQNNLAPLNFDTRAKLDQLYTSVQRRYKAKEFKRLNDLEPKCFTLKQFDSWREYASQCDIKEKPKSYCDDCTPSYQYKMHKKKLCNFPSTAFYAYKRRANEGWEVKGIRATEDDTIKPSRVTRERLYLTTWVDRMHELNTYEK